MIKQRFSEYLNNLEKVSYTLCCCGHQKNILELTQPEEMDLSTDKFTFCGEGEELKIELTQRLQSDHVSIQQHEQQIQRLTIQLLEEQADKLRIQKEFKNFRKAVKRISEELVEINKVLQKHFIKCCKKATERDYELEQLQDELDLLSQVVLDRIQCGQIEQTSMQERLSLCKVKINFIEKQISEISAFQKNKNQSHSKILSNLTTASNSSLEMYAPETDVQSEATTVSVPSSELVFLESEVQSVIGTISPQPPEVPTVVVGDSEQLKAFSE